VISAAILLAGLLLVVASLVTAKVTGEATFASPVTDGPAGAPVTRLGPVRRSLLAFVISPIHATTWHSNGAILVGVLAEAVIFAFLASLLSIGSALLFAGVGIVFVGFGIEVARAFARFERRRAESADPRPLHPHPYRELSGGIRALLLGVFADASRWRDMLYVAVNLPLVAVEFAVTASLWVLALELTTLPLWFDAGAAGSVPGIGGWAATNASTAVLLGTLAGLLLLPVAGSVSQIVQALQRAVVSGLLCTSESRELQQRVETLRESRSAVLDVEASELRRIERDLHDGAQQRLVRLTMDLSRAAERIEGDPDAARQLVLESRDQARQALAEIRDLVRGIAPAILVDRGLEAALGSLAGRAAVPTAVVSGLAPGRRLPDAVERAAYFVVAEALTNVGKHGGARRCEVRCRVDGERLVVEIWDDGAGGAQIRQGGGLAGLVGRVEALDGTFSVISPTGGPTRLRAEIPVTAWRPPWAMPPSAGATAGPVAGGTRRSTTPGR
jgi:signal transduction histidine kinase